MNFRECGDCNMCCKLPSVINLKKEYEWWKHCEIGVGCKIYEERPKQCKDFYCLWKMNLLSENLKPNKVGFFVMMENEHSAVEKVLTVYCETHKVNSIPKSYTPRPRGIKDAVIAPENMPNQGHYPGVK